MGFVSDVGSWLKGGTVAANITRVAGDVERGARTVAGATSGAVGGAGAAQASYRPPSVTTIPTPGMAPDQTTMLIIGAIVVGFVVIMIVRK